MNNQKEEKTRILIADDDAMVIEAIEILAEEQGYTVIDYASNGQQAAEKAERLHPDVILMDIDMPKMNGIEATQSIITRCPTPIVILTAYETPELIQQVSKAGAGAYLVKPPSGPEIDRAITIAMARFADMLELRRLNAELQARNEALQQALDAIQTLSGLVPICAWCGKKIQDESGQWIAVEKYITKHSGAEFTHGICPDCLKQAFPKK